jgi:hypothetical protein
VTEAEWRTCSDPDRMLSFLGSQGEPDERRLRLVACACVRHAWHLLPPQAQVTAQLVVEVAEAYAEGAATAADLARVRERAEDNLRVTLLRC